MQRLRSLTAVFALMFLGACIAINTQTTTVTAYEHDGKLYHVEDIAEEKSKSDDVDRTVTMWQVVDGKRQFVGFYTAGETPPDKDEIPAESGHKRTILTVVQQGRSVGLVTESKKEVVGGH